MHALNKSLWHVHPHKGGALSDGWFLRLLQVVPVVEMEKHRRLTAADLYLLAITPISKPEDNTPTPPPKSFYPPLTHTHTHTKPRCLYSLGHWCKLNSFLQSDKFISYISALKLSSFFYLTWSQTCISACHYRCHPANNFSSFSLFNIQRRYVACIPPSPQWKWFLSHSKPPLERHIRVLQYFLISLENLHHLQQLISPAALFVLYVTGMLKKQDEKVKRCT